MAAQEDLPPLHALFANRPLAEHAGQWDALWAESRTSWDRGGPSYALLDLLGSRPDLFPPAATATATTTAGPRRRALVPGCGRGWDVLLLAGRGYDVVGLDVSDTAMREAREMRERLGAEAVFQSPEGVAKGEVELVVGNFFEDGEWKRDRGPFDLIFDYTFLCALPLDARPAWAKRTAELLAEDGRLICLEWPSHKPLNEPGPPWPVRSDTYLAHLSRPGEEVKRNEDGAVAEPPKGPSPGGLKRLALVKPVRTHKAGTDDSGNVHDWISVWGPLRSDGACI